MRVRSVGSHSRLKYCGRSVSTTGKAWVLDHDGQFQRERRMKLFKFLIAHAFLWASAGQVLALAQFLSDTFYVAAQGGGIFTVSASMPIQTFATRFPIVRP